MNNVNSESEFELYLNERRLLSSEYRVDGDTVTLITGDEDDSAKLSEVA